MTASTKQENKSDNQALKRSLKSEKNWLEWCVFGISLMLVISILGYLLYLEFVPATNHFKFDIRIGSARKSEGRYFVPVIVKNECNKTARDVLVEITSANDPSEKKELTFDYVPRHSEREGMALFQKDPGRPAGFVGSFNFP